MAYRYNKEDRSLIIDGFDQGIAPSPYKGIANMMNLNKDYYSDVAYVNYRRQASGINSSLWFAGTHSTNVSGNTGWVFTAPNATTTMTGNPISKCVSELGLIYIQNDQGQIFKQSAVNSAQFDLLTSSGGRKGAGASGIAYWYKYLVVFGAGLIEFCGDGTGDAGIIPSNWNKVPSTFSTYTFLTNSVSANTIVTTVGTLGFIQVNDPVTFTSTGTLPSPLVAGTTYYIKTIEATPLTYTISTTVGGTVVTFTDNGTGTHTMSDNATILPLGNMSAISYSFSGTSIGKTTATLVSYTSPAGVSQGTIWREATGVYAIIDPVGAKQFATFTNDSSTITFSAPIVDSFTGTYVARLLDPTVTNYVPYVSKSDGNLYFANGQFLGSLIAQPSNIKIDPSVWFTYTVSYGVTSIAQPQDTINGMVDLKGQLIIAGNKDLYPWDYIQANVNNITPVGEQIITMGVDNLLNNLYILAGQKGNIYMSNGYSAQLLFKIPDYIAGVIDPVWSFGGLMIHRSKLFFQLFSKNTSGTNLLAGIFSIIVSPTMIGETASGLVMENQNSYGLVPSASALTSGVLIDNSPSANGNDSYYSAWSNGATTGGIDYNDTTLWQNFEPTIETDLIPVGTLLGIQKVSMGNIEFKLDRPMVAGDQIRMYYRTSLSDTYTSMGTTTSAVLSDYYQSNIAQVQWIQFKIQMSCASSGSSFIPLREVRIYYN